MHVCHPQRNKIKHKFVLQIHKAGICWTQRNFKRLEKECAPIQDLIFPDSYRYRKMGKMINSSN